MPRHGEAAVEAHVVRGFLGIGGIDLVVARAHQEASVRYHHHFGPATAVMQRIGERLAGTEQAVMGRQVDALPEIGGHAVARFGDAQDLGQLDPRILQAQWRDQVAHAGVAQFDDARQADGFHPHARVGHGLRVLPDLRGMVQPAPGRGEVAAVGGLFGAPDHRALDRRHALQRTRLARFPLQHFTEAGQRAATCFAQPALAQRPLAGHVQPGELIGFVHPGQIRRNRRIAGRHGACDGRDLACAPQRFGAVFGMAQRLPPLLQQPVEAAVESASGAGVRRIQAQQRKVERNGIVCRIEQTPVGQGGRGTAMRIGNALGRQRHGRRAPVQLLHAAVVATDRHAGHAYGIGGAFGVARTRRIARARGEPRQREQHDGKDRAQTPSVMGATGPRERMPADNTVRRYWLSRDLRLLSPD